MQTGMTTVPRVILALVVALAVGFGMRWFSEGHGSGWVVSPEQIAAARSAGRPGIESSPGTVTVLPIRSETADLDPFLWMGAGTWGGAADLCRNQEARPGVSAAAPARRPCGGGPGGRSFPGTRSSSTSPIKN